jgi:DNA transformation protein and related proteins
VPGTGEVRAQDRAYRASAEDSEFKIRTSIFHCNSMPHKSEYLEYVLEQLGGLRGLVSRRMFSGAGLYQDEQFFALVFDDTLYFKVNDTNRGDYEARGMNRFRPYKDKPHLSFTYYEVPAEVLEDREELVAWARRSVAAAAASKVAKPRKRTSARRKVAKRKTPKSKR